MPATAVAPDRHRRLIAAATLAAIIAAGGVVRVHGLGTNSLSTDEAYTLAFVQRGLGGMVSLFGYEPNGMLYQLLVYPGAHAHPSDVVLRLPAAIAGVLSIPALCWAGAELVDGATGLIAAALLAVLPFAVQQSQTARPYSLVLLLAPVTMAALARAVRATGRFWWWVFAASLVAATYANALSLMFLAPAHLALAWSNGPRARRRLAVSLGAVVIAVLPLAVLLAHDRGRRNPLYWLARPSLRVLASVESSILGGHAEAALALVVVVAGCVAALAARRGPVADLLRGPAGVIGSWAVAAPALDFMLSQAWPSLSGRYLAASVPGACLAVAMAVRRLPPAAGWPALAALLLVPLPVLHRFDTGRGTTAWREASAALARARGPGDPVLFDAAEGVVAAGRYQQPFASPDGRIAVNEWHDEPLPTGVALLQNPGGYSDAPEGPPSVPLVRRLAAATGAFEAALGSLTPAQGDVLRSAGLRWARTHCQVRSESFSAQPVEGTDPGTALTVVVARGCER